MTECVTVLTIFFALVMCARRVELRCIHDELPFTLVPSSTVLYDGKQDVSSQSNTDSSFRTRREEQWNGQNSGTDHYQPIRIHVHYALGVALDTGQKELLGRVVERAVNGITSVLSVVPVIHPLLLSRTCPVVFRVGMNKGKCTRLKKGYRGEYCLGTFKIPDEHLAELHIYNATHKEPKRKIFEAGPGVNDTDLILYIIAKNTRLCLDPKQSVVAYATHCQVDHIGRPIAGLANVCPLAFTGPQLDENMLYQTVLHELLHVLGFSTKLFNTFRKCAGRECPVREKPVRPVEGLLRVVTPAVVNKTQQHFGCRTEPEFGAALEMKDSDATSHWDSRMMHTSLMTALVDQAHTAILDPITLAVFQDSGWYQVDFDHADSFYWGRDAGCKFGTLEYCLQDGRYFCTGNASGCHFLRQNKAVCDALKTDSSCGVYMPVPQQVEMVGRCYETRCSPDGSVYVRLQSTEWIPCTAGHTIEIPGLNVEIQCPLDVEVLCDPSLGQWLSSTSNPLGRSTSSESTSTSAALSLVHATTSPSHATLPFAQEYVVFVMLLLLC